MVWTCYEGRNGKRVNQLKNTLMRCVIARKGNPRFPPPMATSFPLDPLDGRTKVGMIDRLHSSSSPPFLSARLVSPDVLQHHCCLLDCPYRSASLGVCCCSIVRFDTAVGAKPYSGAVR